jgi:membrane protease YdiL (CAAX protease family)
MVAGLVGVGATTALTSDGVVLPLVAAVAAVAVYWLVMRFLAGRHVSELAPACAGWRALLGIAIGVAFIATSLLSVVTEFSFAWSTGRALPTVATTAAVALGAAVTEELMFRGLVLQALERLVGTWVALAVTAVAFGAVHLANPAATPWSAVAIAVEAGVLLGAAFLWKRNIWLAVGLHFAWNTCVGLIGIAVSGHPSDGLLVARPTGPDLLTGGSFGIEASIVPVALSVLISVPMLVTAHRRGNLVALRRR